MNILELKNIIHNLQLTQSLPSDQRGEAIDTFFAEVRELQSLNLDIIEQQSGPMRSRELYFQNGHYDRSIVAIVMQSGEDVLYAFDPDLI